MDYVPRKLAFRAWNRVTGLMMRLNNVECVRGELRRSDHVLLQFTGLHDQQQEEIYEMDLLLIGMQRFVVFWDAQRNGWAIQSWPDRHDIKPFQRTMADDAIRICSYFERPLKD